MRDRKVRIYVLSGLFVRQSLKKPPAMQVDNNRFSLQ